MSALATIDLAAKYGDSTLSNYEVFMVGEAVWLWMLTAARLGHTSPASTLDYTTDPAALTLGGLIVRDFVAWTSGRTDLAEGCEERLRQVVADAQLDPTAIDDMVEAGSNSTARRRRRRAS